MVPNKSNPDNKINRGRILSLTATGVLLGFLLFSAAWAAQPIDLAQKPMFSQMATPPANIMILLDDSGSMTWEILVQGQTGGLFPKAGSDDGYAFVFDNPGNSLNVSNAAYDYLKKEGRKYWKSQYHEVNSLYYNPALVYTPWVSYGNVTLPDADPDNPRVHPVRYANNTVNLDDTSLEVEIITNPDIAGDEIEIPHAHYFALPTSENSPYLVVLDGNTDTIRYFKVTLDAGSGYHEKVSALTEVANPPSELLTGRTYAQERQNFANWFSYNRRREYVAKAALGQVLQGIKNVRMGIYGLNQEIVLPLKKIKIVNSNNVLEDEVDTLFEALYDYVSQGGTPLNKGFNTIGEYFKTNDGDLAGESGPKPYGNEAQGGPCQQSFTVVVTDGYYTDPGSVDIGGNLDDNDDITEPYKNWGGGEHPYADLAGNTLADLAFYYYANDLNTTLANKLPPSPFDSAAHQHMVTFAVAFGVTGTLNPQDYTDTYHHQTTGNPIQWPTVPGGQTPETIDDLWHATVNGRGQFKSARNPVQLAASLLEFMKNIVEIAKGSAAPVAVNGDWLYGKLGPDTMVYQASFSNTDEEWTGDVTAYDLDNLTGEVLSGTPIWSAAQQLENIAWNQRIIATYNGGGVSFQEASLSTDQKAQLGGNPEEMVKYLRGLEVATYRERTSKLGDIVNARPVFIDDFLYVGANDGMLHAFDAETGVERFAYIPNLIFPNLKSLADPAYDHRFYVDLTPTVKQAAGIFGGTDSNILLVGGLRAGGKGYFGLDITDAADIDSETKLANRVKWEYPITADDDIGFSYNTPTIVKSNSTSHPWVVIFGNGYNSVNGSAVLYLLDAASGALVRKIDTKAVPVSGGTANGLSTPIAIDVSFDQKVDFVYAGDLFGNLWKFDLSQTDPADWSVAFGDTTTPQPLFRASGPGGHVQPITTRPDVMYHPKKHGMMICFGTGSFLGFSDFSNTDVQTIYGIWDYGDRIYDLDSDTWSDDDNTEYLGTFDRASVNQLSNQPEEVKLLEQTFTDYNVTIAGNPATFRVFSKASPDWITAADPQLDQEGNPSSTFTNHAGYYIDLNQGERVVSDVLIRSGILVAIGFQPDTDRCGSSGRSMFMELNAFSGGNLALVQFDIDGDNQINAQDLIDISNDPSSVILKIPSGVQIDGLVQMPAFQRLGKQRERVYFSNSRGEIPQLVQRSPKLGVTYWMQFFE